MNQASKTKKEPPNNQQKNNNKNPLNFRMKKMLTDLFCALLIANWYGKYESFSFYSFLCLSYKINSKKATYCQISEEVMFLSVQLFKTYPLLWGAIDEHRKIILFACSKACPLFQHIIFLCHTPKNPTRFIGICVEKMKRFSCFVRNLIHSHRWPSSGVILIMR